MKFRLIFLLSSLSLFGHQLTSQDLSVEQWHKAELKLNDKTVLNGDFNYDLAEEKVQIKLEGRVETYNASQIEHCVFYDDSIDLLRLMVALPYAEKTGYKRPKLFEVIVKGKMTLLVREYVKTEFNGRTSGRLTKDRFGNMMNDGNHIMNLDFNFFFAREDGEIRAAKPTQKSVISQFSSNQTDLKKYAKKNKLKMERLEDVVQLVEYYNSGLGKIKSPL